MDADATRGFYLVSQDWRGYGEHHPGRRPLTPRGKKRPPPPAISTLWFATREEAERAKAEARALYRHADIVRCVVPVPVPQAEASPPFDDLPIMHKRLTP